MCIALLHRASVTVRGLWLPSRSAPIRINRMPSTVSIGRCLSYDPDEVRAALTRLLEPLGGIATFVNGLAVSGGTPARSLGEFVAWVRKQGGQAGIGIPAPASTPEFLVQLLGKKYDLKLTPVPYKGSAPMMADMLGNQIPAGVGSVPDFIEYQRAGKLHMIAVLGGQRQAALPGVPTFAELGVKGLEDTPYYGIWAPKGTPADFVNRFTRALEKALAVPEVHRQLTDMGLTVGYMTPRQLETRERAYTRVWSRIIKDSGFQPQ